ncbi:MULTISPECIES: fimbria/pilus outer membrane usher protein [unclassified Polaromonas]|uniref:fimbria/pilus outer membrane usher protein n=1 Tax=unclassified Polaromonas TaxID=2638319 RepID=UPI0018CAAB6E|nr:MULTISPECIES: fimbria/pilus outer membrane usher protein [unclassified Polaromonas]MBG6073339.1 outer membrane usher protein [Polaromonas sp. CG_9.7]MBG6115321.1 outer membrane usher protein [Polaromonas sp. CG_9.2]
MRQAESLLLEVEVNSEILPGIVRVERLADGRLALPVEAWAAARLRPPPGEPLVLPDGQRGYALQDVTGLTHELDLGRLVLQVKAPATAFLETSLAIGADRATFPTPSSPGFYLNYDATLTRTGGNRDNSGIFLEGVAFSGKASFVSGAVVRDNGFNRETVRTETYWRQDLPGRRETLVVGDAVGSGGAWSRPVRYGGIRFARDFSLTPGYISYPLPTLSGSAALPSAVNVIVNNQRRSSGLNVGAGPFDLTQVPVVTGSGEVSLVVRDLRGVETVISQRYYLSPLLLAAGLSDFSFEAGALRRNFGQPDSDYGPGFAAATYRYGITSALTGEGRIETQKERQAAGVEVTGLLASLGSARAAAAWSCSQGDARALPGNGGRYLLGIERSAPAGASGSLQWEHFDAGFEQFGSLGEETRPKGRLQAALGMPLGELSLGMSYTRQTTWEGDNFRLAAVNVGTRLFGNVFLSLYANRQFGTQQGWNAGLSLIMPLEKQRSVIATSNHNSEGRFTNTVQASQPPPIGPGWGWRLNASDQARQQAQAGATLNTHFGQFLADFNTGTDNNAIRLGANGSLGWLADLPFFTRRIDHGAFAVVRVADLAGVPVYRSNQVAALTNARGLALVTDLLPYQQNQLTIDPAELPFDIEIGGTLKMATPYARSGVVVDFPVRRTRNALVVLHQARGAPVPAGARVSVQPGNGDFVVGKRGEAYLMDLGDANHLAVTWKEGGCALDVALDPAGPSEPHLGPLACAGGH